LNRRYLFLSLCAMGVIWFASGRPGDAIALPGGWDKPAHFLEYAALGFLLARGLGETRPRWFLAWCLAAGYGLLDEYHQSFVPGRYPSGADILMDAAGAAAGVFSASLAGGRGRQRL
jgi:VanZ family protein